MVLGMVPLQRQRLEQWLNKEAIVKEAIESRPNASVWGLEKGGWS